ncbi:alpha/beta hydrolase [Amycolatopsis sp. NBC_01307]|uniref:alpha/beta fold hydrolase n=1 Tax=Amycolatopsis sp. NBC_01307 TaxID=2903561 RepID=UPI002E10ABAC|nr:alpha/beta hydrolase [Amycolatopsis sp. NBC_01307]
MDDVVYDRAGHGEPLVLIHGIGHRRQAWAPVFPLLTPHRDVIAVDLPGFGESPEPAGGYGVEPALVMFKDLFTELGLDRPHVAGNSLGGLLSLELGRAGLVRSVTALSPAGLWNRRQKLYAIATLKAHRALAQRTPPNVVRRLAATAAGRKALVGMIVGRPELLSPEIVAEDAHALATAPGFEPTAAQSRGSFRFTGPVTGVPVTIAWAQHDRVLARPRVAELRKVAPNGTFTLLPGCGHVPMSDDPELVAKTLLAGSR